MGDCLKERGISGILVKRLGGRKGEAESYGRQGREGAEERNCTTGKKVVETAGREGRDWEVSRQRKEIGETSQGGEKSI